MKIERTYEYIIPFVLIIMLFFTLRDYLPPLIYEIIAVLSAVYYFPFRVIMNWNLKTKKENIFSLVVNFLFAAAIVLSGIRLYTGITDFIDYSCTIINFVLIVITVSQFISFKTGRDFFICLLINMLLTLTIR